MLDHGWYGILQSAGLLFFAFAGYARIATLGEEVRNPARSIPRAIVVALSIAVALYSLIAVTLLRAFEPHNLAGLSAPLVHLVAQSPWGWAAPVVQVGAAVAALGALLALVAGVGRTVLAMARNGDAPKWLAAVHPVYKVPHHAEIVLAGVMCVLVLTLDVRAAIGFSSFGVLLYYFIANAAALTQTRGNRRYPRVLAVVGGVSCLVLVATLPAPSIIGGLIVLLGGVLYRVARLRSSRGSESG
jgi:APA family basic amino acid/polyamine antiporter